MLKPNTVNTLGKIMVSNYSTKDNCHEENGGRFHQNIGKSITPVGIKQCLID